MDFEYFIQNVKNWKSLIKFHRNPQVNMIFGLYEMRIFHVLAGSTCYYYYFKKLIHIDHFLNFHLRAYNDHKLLRRVIPVIILRRIFLGGKKEGKESVFRKKTFKQNLYLKKLILFLLIPYLFYFQCVHYALYL